MTDPADPNITKNSRSCSVERVVQHTGAGDLRRHHVGEVGFGHVHQKPVVDRSCGVDDSADRPASVSDVAHSARSFTWSASVISTLAVVTRAPRLLDLADRVDGRVMPVVVRQHRPLVSRRDLASAQQCNMTCAAFGQVGGHDAAEGSGSTGDDVGRVGSEFGWERLVSGSCSSEDAGRTSCGRGWRSDPRVHRRECARRYAKRSPRGRRRRRCRSVRPIG